MKQAWLANRSISRTTIIANEKGSWLTIIANRPATIAKSARRHHMSKKKGVLHYIGDIPTGLNEDFRK
jgi:hypothetical protein